MKNKFARISAVMGGAAVIVASSVQAACATGTADAGVTAAFQTVTDNSQATLTAIGAIAVTIMGVFLAWKYGRKIFSAVAK